MFHRKFEPLLRCHLSLLRGQIVIFLCLEAQIISGHLKLWIWTLETFTVICSCHSIENRANDDDDDDEAVIDDDDEDNDDNDDVVADVDAGPT